jgi:predicted GNAT family acetyltransferase
MAIDVRDNPDRNRYEVFLEDELAGFTSYQRAGNEITVSHTEVDPRFEGKGIGSGLVRGVLDDVRRADLALLPRCDFIKGYIARHDEYADLVPAERRSEFGL